MKAKKNKVLLIGWDAADWKIIDKLLEKGLMPTLQKFLSEGVRGNIATLDPPLSPILWTSIGTGMRAYKHGILGFVEPDKNGEDMRSVSSSSRKVKAIWNILNQNNLKSNVTAWWPSFPVEKINGNMVCNFIQLAHKNPEEWEIGDNMVHPLSLKEELSEIRVHPTEITPALVQPFIPLLNEIDPKKDVNLHNFLNIFAQTLTVHSVATYLLREKEADFNAVYFDGIDHFCHGFMKFHPPQMEMVTDRDFQLYKDVINNVYRFFDMTLERYLDLIDKDTTIIIVSDHGFHSDHLRPKNIPNDPAGPAAEHRALGVFCARGPGIKKGETIYGASILDITPTLLQIYGLPVGKDMDGVVLHQIFEKPEPVNFIESWEDVDGNDGRHSEELRNDPWAEKQALDQLIELGYVDAPNADKKKNVDLIADESNYYLAKAYINGKKTSEALPILRSLQAKRPGVARYVVTLLHSLLETRNHAEVQDLINVYRKRKEIKPFYLDFFEGKLNQQLFKPNKAYDLFNSALAMAGNWAELNFEIGKCLITLNHWEQAEAPLLKAIEIDKENAIFYQYLGISYLRRRMYEEALDNFLEAINRAFYLPNVHYHIGECFYFMERFDEALNAYLQAVNLFPGMSKAHRRIIDIYTRKNETEKIKIHQEFMENNVKETVYIVSGLPRSGTSMMMQMLHQGGMEVLVDEKRAADDSNPKGYYEFEPVKGLLKDNSWVHQGEGKVVKVIAQLLAQMPTNYTYKVIFMQRPMAEVIKSQQVMLKQDTSIFPTAIASAFDKTLLMVKEWEKNNPNVSIHYVNYHEVISKTEEQSKLIKTFLGLNLNIEEMVQAVHPELHRNKS